MRRMCAGVPQWSGHPRMMEKKMANDVVVVEVFDLPAQTSCYSGG